MLKKLHNWHTQSKLRSLVRWKEERTKGKARFVVRAALTYNAIAIPAYGFTIYLLDGEMLSWQSGLFWMKAAGYCLTGAVIGVISWASMERQYNEALLDGRIAAALAPPQASALPQESNSDSLSFDVAKHPNSTRKTLT